MPTISQMRYVVSVANLGSFQNAAKACYITQPTLSMQIQKLENELDTIMFDRSKKPIMVTDRGQSFIKRFQTILNEVAQIEEMTRMNTHKLSGSFRIGVIPTIAPVLSPIIFQYFRKRHPSLQLQLLEKTTNEIILELKSEQLDGGVLSTPLEERNIFESQIYQEKLVVFHHPKIKIQKNPKLKELESFELILLSDQNCLRQQTIGLCSLHAKKILKSYETKIEAQSITSLFEMVRNIPSYCLIPESFTALLSRQEQANQIKQLKDSGAYREIGIVKYRQHLKEKPFHELENCIAGFAQEHRYSMHTKKPLSPL